MLELVKDGLNEVMSIYSHATCGGMTMRLFYVACACLFLFSVKDKIIKNWIIIPTFLYLVGFLLNPLLFGRLIGGDSRNVDFVFNGYVFPGWMNSAMVNSRFYYILPIEIVVAYGLVRIMAFLNGRGRKLMFFCFIILALNTYGDFGYNNGYCVKADNLYDVPEACIRVSECMDAEIGEGSKRVVAPEEISQYIRQYDPSILLAFGRAYASSFCNTSIKRLMVAVDEIDYTKLCENVIQWKADFFIEDTSWKTIGELPAEKFVPIANVRKDDTAEYVVYRVVQPDAME